MNPVYGCLDRGNCCVSGGSSRGGEVADFGGKLGMEGIPGFVC